MLYLIATPLGNLKDITLRALDTLRACDYILCEDTRHSAILLAEYQISKPLLSYHKFNEKEREIALLEDLRAGKQIALLSDAGTPGVCDPGDSLLRRCRLEGLPHTSLPGPCAFALALSLSSFRKDKVQFLGFLPQEKQKFQALLAALCAFRGTSFAYEAPHRLLSTLQSVAAVAPSLRVGLFRELTKKFEEVLETSASDLLSHLQSHPPRGEIVLAFEGFSEASPTTFREEVLAIQRQFSLSLAEAIKVVAELHGVPKKTVYAEIHLR